MANFVNTQKGGINQFALLGSPIAVYHFGLGVLPQTEPARAVTLDEFTENSTDCLTEVFDWPFTQDENGIAFDKDNLYGVRTQTIRQVIGSGGGDRFGEELVAVPKTLPSGYTESNRCGIVVPLIQDFLFGIGPSQYGAVIVRSATSDDVFSDDQYKKAWTPMNRGSQGYQTSFVWGVEVDGNSDYSYIATDHIGFRTGGKLVTTISGHGGDPSKVWDHSGVLEFYSLDSDQTGGLNYIGQISEDLYQNSSDNVVETAINFALPSETLGKTSNFFVKGTLTLRDTDMSGNPSDPPTYTQEVGTWFPAVLSLGPRTDVPLWYFASKGNKCAPGGIVT